ncbi:MAG: Gfo/Idh/MocA family oxidoreductase [Desulfobacterales bacterium]|jgi:predicted dehydrogenase
MGRKLKFGLVGMGFGANFAPILKHHPNTELYALCRRSPAELEKAGMDLGVTNLYTDFGDMLSVAELDAILIMSPVPEHYAMAKASLEAGKHTAVTVPMAETKEQCIDLLETRKQSGKVYMMFETAVYTRTFLYVKELLDSGKLGKIQFLRGSHQQNMSMPGWPDYWYGFPPMLYATHALSPLLALPDKKVESVCCFGSGTIRNEYSKRYNSPFAVETAFLKLKDSDLVCEVTRSLFDTIRQFRESFDVYASKLSFEWEQISGEGHVLHSNLEDAERISIPDYAHHLPESIQGYCTGKVADKGHASSIQGGGHGGSYPHMVHEFVSAIVESRPSAIDADKAANWTMAGICAHDSAMQNGEKVTIPETVL